jgi:hypothetical protein
MGTSPAGAVVILPLVLGLGACGGSPTAPASSGVTLTLPAQMTATVVTCATCTPAIWAFAETTITLTNRGDRDRRVTTVEARVLNKSRSTVLATNVRPNEDATYPDRFLPRNAALSLEAAVAYRPLPPPRDEIWFVVVVTFEDGGTLDNQSRLFTPTS